MAGREAGGVGTHKQNRVTLIDSRMRFLHFWGASYSKGSFLITCVNVLRFIGSNLIMEKRFTFSRVAREGSEVGRGGFVVLLVHLICWLGGREGAYQMVPPSRPRVHFILYCL